MAKCTVPALGLVALLLAAPSTTSAQETEGAELLLILDASGSMWGQIDGENKIVIARRALRDLLAELPDETPTGLVAYGHRRDGDCADIETVVPMGPLDRAAMGGVVEGLNPKGKTPITASIEHALAAIEDREAPVTMILVSDGLETCGGDPCAAVRAARESGAGFLLHVVGFGIEEDDVSQLECAAQAGGGLYLPAADAAQLADALGRAVEASAAPEEPPATLSVEATADGAPLDAMVIVLAPGGEALVAGRTYTGPETNPRLLPVPPGTYDVVVRAMRLKGEPEIRFASVEVPGGEIVERRADFSSGELVVGVTRNGELSDAGVTITRSGETVAVAGGRTYRTERNNPAVYRLTPGDYAVEIKALEIESAPLHRWERLTIRPQERTEVAHDFVSGVLSVQVVDGDTLVDAGVVVSQDGTSVAGGRTYTGATSNPRRFNLEPGTYTVVVRAVRHADGEPRELEVTVEATETVEEVVRVGGG